MTTGNRGLEYEYMGDLPEFIGTPPPTALVMIWDPDEATPERATKVVMLSRFAGAGDVTRQELADDVARLMALISAETTAREGETAARERADMGLGDRITTLQTRSDAGDEIGVEVISRPAQLVALFGSQERNDNAAWVYFTAAVTEAHDGRQHTFAAGDLAYFAPRNILGKVVTNVPVGLAGQITALTDTVGRNTGSISISPNNIPNAAAIQRNFVFAAEDLDVAWLTSKGVNELEIWFNNTPFHSVDPWAPTADVRLNVNVNATEAAAIAVGSDTIIPVRAVFRSDGQFVALVNSWLTIGGQGGGGSAGVPDAPTGAGRYELSVPASGPNTWEAAGTEATLSQKQQIGLLSIHPEPSIIVYPNGGLETALTRTIAMQVANPEVLTGTIWVEGQVDGQAVLARTEWATNLNAINFVISAQLARSIGQNDSLDVRLDFYDAASDGNIVESLRYGVSLVEQAQVGAAGATAAQAAAIQANTAGRQANAGAIAQNLGNINTNRANLQAEITRAQNAEIALGRRIDAAEEVVIHYSDPATTTPAAGEVLVWEGRVYIFGPKRLITRDLLGSDFRQSGYTWAGISNVRPSGSPAAGRVYFTYNAFGSIVARTFYVSQGGGGFSPVAPNHTPASWGAYDSLAEAAAGTNAINTVIILPQGGFFVTGILPDRWLQIEGPLQQTVTPKSEATAVNVDDGAVIDLEMTMNVTLQLTGGDDGTSVLVRATQDATGSRTLAFHSSIMGKDAPTLTTAAGKTDFLHFNRQGARWKFVSSVLDV